MFDLKFNGLLQLKSSTMVLYNTSDLNKMCATNVSLMRMRIRIHASNLNTNRKCNFCLIALHKFIRVHYSHLVLSLCI